MKAKYGLPDGIKFCKRCVMPNTRPSSSNEYQHTIARQHNFLKFDQEDVCSACRFCEAKDKIINWEEREKELVKLLDKYRSSDGSYDVLVPGSGGKDSVYASYLLKYKYGMHPLTVTWSPHLYTDIGWENLKSNEIFLGGKSVSDYLKEGVSYGDLSPFLPLNSDLVKNKNIEFHFLGFYIKWVHQECYYFAVKHTGFEANPVRTEGTYSKYNSIDDKTDGYFYYTTYIKFGYGRATQDAAQEIRNHHITRDEGVALVRRFDGEFPKRYFQEFLEYLDLPEKEFTEIVDSFRDPHLWKQENGEWKLKHNVN